MNRKHIATVIAGVVTSAFLLWAPGAHAATANITPTIDNTVAEELPDNSSGECDSIFSGNIDNPALFARRALMQFDIAGNVPPGAVITSVTLSMSVTRGGNHIDSTFTLHPLNAAWVEGTEGCGVRGGGQGEPSTGGVTWNTQPGFGAASGSTLVNTTTPVWASTQAMIDDGQAWLDNPGSNYGYILIGDEATQTTTRRFDSSEGASPPVLTVEFDSDGFACCFQSGDCNIQIDEAACLAAGGDSFLPGTDSCGPPNPCPQPAGACCNVDNTCSEDQDRQVCENAGGTFQGGNVNCNQADCGLTPFVEPLPIPPILQPTGTRGDGVLQYTVSIEEATQSVHPDLPPTDLWTYNGAWPSSTIVATKGTPTEVTYVNNLPATGGGGRGNNILEIDTCSHGPNDWGDSKRVVTHLHGGHVPARVDGQPEYHILPGETDVYEYPNNQDAGTVWYHDHALGITRLNVYAGMAGFYLIADSEDTLGPDNAFGLPSGQYEIGMAIQDRTFNEDGSLFYNAQLEDAFKGENVLVNGKVQPYLDVDQGKYRFRILNGSQSREYSLRLENITDPGNDPSFTLVGTDLGLVSAPIDLGPDIGLQGPAERMDVVIDFAGFPTGTEIILRNDDLTQPLLPSVMKFVVTGNPGYTGAISSTLRTVTPMPESSADVTRYFRLTKDTVPCTNDPGRMVNEWLIESLDGPGGAVTGKHWDDVTEFPILGQREVWEFENPTNSYHPMHVHLVRFQIVSKTDLNTGQPIPLEPWEVNTWKDIVHIPANSKARIIMDFEDYAGRFPNHCHLLDHEDHEMMRQFQASYDPANCNNNGSCDPGEDCVSCAADCAQVSGASCGNGLCEAGDGENCLTCPEDCAGKQKGSQQNQFCCGAPGGNGNIGCGVDVNDDRCINAADNLFCRVTARVSACCGDALCEGLETIGSCAVDCDPNACSPTEPGTEVTCDDGNDNDCDGLIDGADPDCQVCVPDETPEQSCFDGNDNDCDELTDCADTADCEGAIGAPTSCGVGACASTGNETCSGGTQSDTCTPGTPGVEGPEGDLTCSDGIDNDCDGDTDANDADCAGAVVCEDITTKSTCNNEPTCDWQGSPQNGMCVTVGGGVCTDGDGDGYGDPGDASCPNGAQTDCDDNNASVNPGAGEGPEGDPTCSDGLDNNCDGNTDAADPACQPPVDCNTFGDKTSCNAEPACKWQGSPQNGSCNPR